MAKKLLRDTSGVSIVIGAMILIVVVVSAATGVAYTTSKLQQQYDAQKSLAASIEMEELDMLKITLYEDAAIDDFEGEYEYCPGKEGTEIGYWMFNDAYPLRWHSSGGTMELVEDHAPDTYGTRALKFTGINGDFINTAFTPFEGSGSLSFWIKSDNAHNYAVDVLLKEGGTLKEKLFINITNANEWRKITTSSREFDNIQFILNGSTTIYLDDLKYYNPDYWGEVEVSLRNLNVDDSTLREISINNYWVKNYSVHTSDRKKEVFTRLHPYTIPAQSFVPIRMNFLRDFDRPVEIERTYPRPVDVLVITSLGNNFMRMFSPPVPLAEVEVKSEWIASTKTKDYLILDASESFDPDGYIVGYEWSIYCPNDTTFLRNQTGMKVRADITNSTNPTDFETGPFYIDFAVTDDTGMVAKLAQQSGMIYIPVNENFNNS
jgi:hypothetical protein